MSTAAQRTDYTFLHIAALVPVCGVLFLSVAHPAAAAEETVSRENIIAEVHASANEQTAQIGQEEGGDEDTEQNQESTPPTTELQNTGDGTDSQDSSTSESTVEGASQNVAAIEQSVDASANTGHNTANRNISFGGDAGVIQTGDATVRTTSVVQANTQETAVSQGSPNSGTQQQVQNAGDSSSSNTQSASANRTTLTGNNQATIYQSAMSAATTGNNQANRNISFGGAAGVISTGNASTTGNYLVAANQSVALVGGQSSGNGPGSGAAIVVDNTGQHARYTMSARRAAQMSVQSSNSAAVQQSCGAQQLACTVNTGYNSANRSVAYGADAGVIQTGDAYLGVLFSTSLNATGTALSTSQSPGYHTSNFANTGDGSTSSQNQSSALTAQVQSQNTGSVRQHVSAHANTGHNTANRNISFGGNAGVITTGNATVEVGMMVYANDQQTQVLYTPALISSQQDSDQGDTHTQSGTQAFGASNTASNQGKVAAPAQSQSSANAGQAVAEDAGYATAQQAVFYNPVSSTFQLQHIPTARPSVLGALQQALIGTAYAADDDATPMPKAAQAITTSLPSNPLGFKVVGFFSALALAIVGYLVKPVRESINSALLSERRESV